jgi:hypothetical protein
MDMPLNPAGQPPLVLHLRDAVYSGGNGSTGRVVSVWAVKADADDTPILSASDNLADPAVIADHLYVGALGGTTFAVCPLNITWATWQLKTALAGVCAIRGSDNLVKSLQDAFANRNPDLAVADTGSLAVPIGMGMSLQTSWQVWFDAQAITIQIQPKELNPSASASRPSNAIFGLRSGLQLSDTFLNYVFSGAYKNKDVPLGSGPNGVHISNIVVSAQTDALSFIGNLKEVPASATVRIESDWSGTNLALTSLGVQSINNVPQLNCGSLSTVECLQLKLKINVGAAVLTARFKGTPLKPSEAGQNLGQLVIGAKTATGTITIDQIGAVSGATVIAGNVRLRAAP